MSETSRLLDVLEAAAADLEAVRFLEGTSYARAAAEDRDRCRMLLSAKLIHEARRELAPPVVVTVTGGTNVGKSTTFNQLAGRIVSAIDETAGATKAPCLYVHARHAPLLEGGTFLPGYAIGVLEDRADLVAGSVEKRAYYVVHEDPALEPFLLVDSPDVDSTVLENARIGLDLLYAADVLVLVTTDQKYLDRRPLDHLKTAVDLDREVLVVFNKMQGEENFQTIRSDFATQLAQRYGVRVPLAAFCVPHYGRGGPSELGAAGPFRPVLNALLSGETVLRRKRRGFEGSAAYFAREVRHLLETFRRERESLGRLGAELDARAARQRAEYEGWARKMASDQFYELKGAIRSVLERYRIPIVDDVFDRVRTLAEGAVGFVKRRVLGLAGSAGGLEADIARRKDSNFERVLDGLAAVAGDTNAALRRARDDSEVAARVYDALAVVGPLPRAELRAIYDERMAAVEDLSLRLEERILEWLAENPSRSAYLHLFKILFRVGVGGLTAFLTGGIGPEDLLYGPISVPLTEAALGQLAPPGFFKRFQDEFLAVHLGVFDDVLARGWLDRARAAMPGSEGAADDRAASLAARLVELERLASAEAEAGAR